MRIPIAVAVAALAVIEAMTLPSYAIAQPAHAWEIGPIIKGRNYSVGMPLNPTPTQNGWYFNFPHPNVGAGHVHYVTFNPGSMWGKTKIVMRYRVEAAPGVRFIPRETPSEPATVSLFFQRAGDSWSGKRHGYHRWYAPPQTVRRIVSGDHEITVNLRDQGWVSVFGMPSSTNPGAFRDALAETHRLGIVFGSAGARGHGVYSTGPARFTLVSFRVI